MCFRTFGILKLIHDMPVAPLFFFLWQPTMPLLYFQYLRKSRAPLLYFQYLQRSRAPLLRTPVSCGHHGLYKTVTPGLLAGRHGSWPVLARTRGGLLGLLRKTLPSDKRDVSEEKKCLFRAPPPASNSHPTPASFLWPAGTGRDARLCRSRLMTLTLRAKWENRDWKVPGS